MNSISIHAQACHKKKALPDCINNPPELLWSVVRANEYPVPVVKLDPANLYPTILSPVNKE